MPDIARFANRKGLIRQKAIAYAGYLPWRVACDRQTLDFEGAGAG